MVGTVVPPSPQVQNVFYIVRANMPGDVVKLIYDPTVATSVAEHHAYRHRRRDVRRLSSVLDISGTFTERRPSVTNTAVQLLVDNGLRRPATRPSITSGITGSGPVPP